MTRRGSDVVSPVPKDNPETTHAASVLLQKKKNPISFYHGKGCGRCNKSGYKGLSGIYEGFEINEELRGMIIDRLPSSELMQAARRGGMRTLREDGVLKILEGETTVEEVLKETQL